MSTGRSAILLLLSCTGSSPQLDAASHTERLESECADRCESASERRDRLLSVCGVPASAIGVACNIENVAALECENLCLADIDCDYLVGVPSYSYNSFEQYYDCMSSCAPRGDGE